MNLIKYLFAMVMLTVLSACGGGGGNPGTPISGTSTGTTVAAPSMTLFVYDAVGTKVYSVSSGAVFTARATVLDAAGAPVANKLVTFKNGNYSNLTLSAVTSVTSNSGVAEIAVSPSSTSTGGGVSLTAAAEVDGKAITAQVDFSVAANSSSTTAAAVADFVLLLSKNTINNSGTDKAQLTVTTVDAKRNVVAGASVVVASDQNSIFTPSGGATTDLTGSYGGILSIGGDKTNRDITLTVTVNGIVKRTTVRVSGSQLTIQVSPSAPAPGKLFNVIVKLVDSVGVPIPGAEIALDGDIPALQGQKITTDLDGIASKADVVAPTLVGSYVITASGSGAKAPDYQLKVVNTTIPDAVIPSGATPSLSASPNVLSVNSPGDKSSYTDLRFQFLDGTNSPVKNVRVRFMDTTIGLAAVGASLSSAGTTLYTDDSGQVTVRYYAGQNSSPTSGVSVRACYKAVDFVSSDFDALHPDNPCPTISSVDVNLTTSGKALAVSIGDDNILSKGAGTYIKNFAVTVADSAGRAMANAPVAISVDLTHYGKGLFEYPYLDAAGVPVGGNGLTVVPSDILGFYPSSTTVPGAAVPNQRIWCRNEDTNRNGNVDPGENINGSADSNGQPTLEPRKSDLLVSYADPTVTTTNASGVLVIKVEYSQRFGTWLAYRVRVTTNVSGSQGLAERLFVTDILQDDIKNGSFLVPPYGIDSCVSPN